jgi:two-component system phosphate regulon sensor histidine kinase PhoR
VKRWLVKKFFSLVGWMLLGGFIGFWAQWFAAREVTAAGILAGMLAGSVINWSIRTWRAFSFAQWIALGAHGERGSWGREAGWERAADWIERRIRASKRRADNEIRNAQQLLAAMDDLPVGILMLDERERIEWVNKAALVHFDLERERDHLQHFINLARHPDVADLLNNRRFDKTVYLTRGPDKSRLAIRISPFTAASGSGRERLMVLSRDVSDIERADHMRRDFVANASHEIRTPVTVLSGFIETLRTVPLTDEERNRSLETMAAQVNRMRSLIDDLLFLARIEGAPTPPLDTLVPVAALIKQAEEPALVLSNRRHDFSFAENVPDSIAGIERELAGALINLVLNAVHYTPEGGHIAVTWHVLPNGDGILAVKDDGIGISRDDVPRLTERFYRVDRSRSRETGGTGLGLSIVKHVQSRHNGALRIDSEPGKGSTFSLVYPAKRVKRG